MSLSCRAKSKSGKPLFRFAFLDKRNGAAVGVGPVGTKAELRRFAKRLTTALLTSDDPAFDQSEEVKNLKAIDETKRRRKPI